MNNNITALYIDLFCGAGGTSSGVEYARLDGRKCAEVNMSRVLCEALCRRIKSMNQ